MGGLRQKTPVPQRQAEIPRRIRPFMADDDGVEQAFSSYLLNAGTVEFGQLSSEQASLFLRVLRHLFLLQHFQGGNGYGRGKGVAPVGGTMLPRFDGKHDVII